MNKKLVSKVIRASVLLEDRLKIHTSNIQAAANEIQRQSFMKLDKYGDLEGYKDLKKIVEDLKVSKNILIDLQKIIQEDLKEAAKRYIRDQKYNLSSEKSFSKKTIDKDREQELIKTIENLKIQILNAEQKEIKLNQQLKRLKNIKREELQKEFDPNSVIIKMKDFKIQRQNVTITFNMKEADKLAKMITIVKEED